MEDFDDMHKPLLHQCPECCAPCGVDRGLLCPRCKAREEGITDREFGLLIVGGALFLWAVHGLATLVGG